MEDPRHLRLERLRKLIQPDIHALPDRPLSPEPVLEPVVAAVIDDDASGGVSLEGLSLGNVPPQTTNPSKATLVELSTKATPAPAVSANPAPAPAVLVPAPAKPDHRFIWVEGAASYYNPDIMESPTGPPATDLQRGDLAPAHYHFSPIQALSKYPYMFCNKTHSQAIASAFIDKGKFWERVWDLLHTHCHCGYYVYDLDSDVPVILVRETQFQDLINEINKKLNLVLRITDEQREEGLVTRFPDHPTCLPRYLGRSHSREEHDSMVRGAPNSQFLTAGERRFGPPDSVTLENFRQLMADIATVQNSKNKAKKVKYVQRMEKQISVINQFKRGQCYLGLHPDEATASSGIPPAIDPARSAPFAFKDDVVFVCVDVEQKERDANAITEVGIATLDTRDLVGVAPGTDGEGWRKKVKARHFRISEYKHHRNHEFCAGHPDGFDFGDSTFVSLADAPRLVEAVFYPPFGVHTTNTPEDEVRKLLPRLSKTEQRKVILLGHNISGDIKYLQKLGYDPLKNPNIVEAMDTAKIYQAWRRELQPTNLGRILLDFEIIGWKLHNAGNDAVYTIQVLLATCVREATIRGSPELGNLRVMEKLTREAAEQRAKDEATGWSENEAGADGGVPVPLTL